MNTKFHIDVINHKFNHSNNMSQYLFGVTFINKYAVLFYTITYLYIREPFL